MQIKSEHITSSWSGGKTTELFIYPQNAIYSERNFDFRISTATVEVEESEFTSLPNYLRILSVIQGEVILSVNKQQTVKLNFGEQFSFSGADHITSKGKITDFNVIYSYDWEASLHCETISERKTFHKKATSYAFLYIVSGNAIVGVHEVKSGDLILLEQGLAQDLVIDPTDEVICNYVELVKR
jgi:environmental stress-induced protein Ves